MKIREGNLPTLAFVILAVMGLAALVASAGDNRVQRVFLTSSATALDVQNAATYHVPDTRGADLLEVWVYDCTTNSVAVSTNTIYRIDATERITNSIGSVVIDVNGEEVRYRFAVSSTVEQFQFDDALFIQSNVTNAPFTAAALFDVREP